MAGYVFKITLENAYPPVWRRVLVLEKITFYDLHSVIQTVFGWDDMHLHSFSLPSQHVEIGPNDDGWSEYDETETLLEQFIFEQKNLRYTYDFGDDWIHKITFEKEDPETSALKNLFIFWPDPILLRANSIKRAPWLMNCQEAQRGRIFLSVKKFSIIRAFEIREFRRICAS